MTRRVAAAWAAAAAVAACELKITSVVPDQPVVIVQGVLNTARDSQFVLVEYSRNGTGFGGFGAFSPPFPTGRPITNARVTLTHLNPGACSTPTVQLTELPLQFEPPEPTTSGIYFTASFCPLRPGDAVGLRVETPAGEIVTGRTTVPGARTIAIDVTGAPPGVGNTVRFNRDHDTLHVRVDPLLGRAMQVEIRRRAEGFQEIPFTFLVDTMAITFPGSLVDPFGDERIFFAGQLQPVFVAMVDSNYYDFARSGSDPFTGRGFINHLEGGVGVFGSVNPVARTLRVGADWLDRREGVYRLLGQVGATPVDVEIELYVGDEHGFPSSFRQVSAFFAGAWINGPVEMAVHGTFERDDLQLSVPESSPDPFSSFVSSVRGVRRDGGVEFPVAVHYRSGTSHDSPILVDTLRMMQIASP